MCRIFWCPVSPVGMKLLKIDFLAGIPTFTEIDFLHKFLSYILEFGQWSSGMAQVFCRCQASIKKENDRIFPLAQEERGAI